MLNKLKANLLLFNFANKLFLKSIEIVLKYNLASSCNGLLTVSFHVKPMVSYLFTCSLSFRFSKQKIFRLTRFLLRSDKFWSLLSVGWQQNRFRILLHSAWLWIFSIIKSGFVHNWSNLFCECLLRNVLRNKLTFAIVAGILIQLLAKVISRMLYSKVNQTCSLQVWLTFFFFCLTGTAEWILK